MTLETLIFLRTLISNQQLSVGAPDFHETVTAVEAAIAELDAAIDKAQRGPE